MQKVMLFTYYQLMTPKQLAKHVTIHGSYTYKPNYLEILFGSIHSNCHSNRYTYTISKDTRRNQLNL